MAQQPQTRSLSRMPAHSPITTRSPAAGPPAPGEAIISVRDLSMRYAKHHVLTGLSFEVRYGELFARLGPNGAGRPNIGF
jgi:ABC-type molybdenum transport system ATPase subunit/photorepair protein PhrA